MPGTLFIVATPIGNLEDVTFRALRTLREVGVIAAEDTRRTAKLLARYQIRTPTISLHAHNEQQRLPQILSRLGAGVDVALVTDAGTPAISDPGSRTIRAALSASFKVTVVPGVSAVIAAAVLSGQADQGFVFAGFPPRRLSDLNRWMMTYLAAGLPLIIFESPHRVRQLLKAAGLILGDRPIMVARELTKLHEEVLRGTTQEILDALAEPRGEYTLVIGPSSDGAARRVARSATDEPATWPPVSGKRRDALRHLADQHGLSLNQLYQLLESARSLVN
jgi:16S rRNA (cytidine1402-2'-O)-methyltransferase